MVVISKPKWKEWDLKSHEIILIVFDKDTKGYWLYANAKPVRVLNTSTDTVIEMTFVLPPQQSSNSPRSQASDAPGNIVQRRLRTLDDGNEGEVRRAAQKHHVDVDGATEGPFGHHVQVGLQNEARH